MTTVTDRWRLPIDIDPRVGPWEEGLHLTLHSGVNLLQWENGAGKTLLMQMIAAASREKLRVGDIPISCPGVDLSASIGEVRMHGRRGKRPKKEGDLGVPVEFLPNAIETLATGDHRVGKRPAFEARMRALSSWVAMELDEKALEELLGKDPRIAQFSDELVIGGDLLDQVQTLRKHLMAAAREEEETLGQLRTELDESEGLKKGVLGDLDESTVAGVEKPAAAEQRARLSDLRDELGGLKTKREERLEEERRRKKALEEMPPRPDTLELRGALATAKAAEQKSITALEAAAEALEAAKAAHEKADRANHQARTETNAAANLLAEREKSRASWDRQKELLEEPLDVPREAMVAKLQQRVDSVAAEVALHEAAEKFIPLAAKIESIRDQAAVAETNREFYDQESKDAWKRLATIMNKRLNSEEIRISDEDEEVQILVDGTWRNIANPDPEKAPDQQWVSEGVRFSACYRLLLEHRQGERIINIRDSTPVGPARMEEIGLLAIEKGILLNLETPVLASKGRYEVLHYPALEGAPA